MEIQKISFIPSCNSILRISLGVSIMSSVWITFTDAFQSGSTINTRGGLVHTRVSLSPTTYTDVRPLIHTSALNALDKSQHAESNMSEGGTYRRFATYAWEKILSSGLVEEALVPEHLATNSCPNRGGGFVEIEVKSASPKEGSPLRCARYALLETLDDKENRSGIQVLNLVLFPNSHLPLPVLGMDLVSLPGNKHLIALDFQPILQPKDEDDNDDSNESSLQLFPSQYATYETRIRDLHETHVASQQELVPWGGDIPSAASRFFSPYALWTRLLKDVPEENLAIIDKNIYNAFCAYVDLYLELLMNANGTGDEIEKFQCSDSDAIKGHRDYLKYRKDNDPARPMLTRLFGKQYTEDVISNVLFEMI